MSRRHLLRGTPQNATALGVALLMGAGLGMPAVPGLGVSPATAQAAGTRRVSLDFVQTDVNIVAKALSIQSKTNVVVLPSVKGAVTVRLIELTVDEALRKVAAAVGAEVRQIEGTYFLGNATELRSMLARGGVKESLTLRYLSAVDARGLVQAAYPFLLVEAVGRSLLVLSGSQDDVAGAARLARDNDVAPPEEPKPEPPRPVVTRDTYTVKYAKPAVLTATLEQAFPDMRISAVERTLVLEGTQDAHQRATKLLAALDTEGSGERTVRSYHLKYLHPIQVAMQLKKLFPNLIVEAGFEPYSPPTANFQPLTIEGQATFQQSGGGQQGGQQGGQGGQGAQAQQELQKPGSRARDVILIGMREDVEQATELLVSRDVAPRQVVIEARVVDITPETTKQLGFTYEWTPLTFFERNAGRAAYQFGGWARAPFNWQVTLDAMEQRRDARVLARPNVSVVDGEEATIFIGDILRYERLVSVTDAGLQTFTIESVPVGVALLCRPRVNTDGAITLKVHPVVSTVTAFTGRNRDIPVTASREADSTLMMKDGETIAFGGLLREEEVKILTKVPILGDLPLFGQLFRHRNNTKKRSEVTIFLTARIVNPGS